MHRRAPAARQRGVAAVFAAVGLVMMVAVLGFLIDVGRLYYAQRDLQKMATAAASDAVRTESGCYTGGTGTQGSLAAAKAVVMTTLASSGPTGDSVTITPVVEFGAFDGTTTPGVRGFMPLNETNPAVNAVRVSLSRPMPARLIPFPGTGPAAGILRATASAQHAAVASFRIGSTLLSLNNPSYVTTLCALLGINPCNISINAATPTGLANASVTLADIAAQLGVGVSDNLLTTNFPESALLTATANALAATGQTAAAATLDQLAALADPSRTTTLGDVLGIESAADAVVAGLPINASELLNAIALSAAQGLYPLKLNLVSSNPLVAVEAFLSLGESEQQSMSPDGTPLLQSQGLGRPGLNNGVARTRASTSQLKLNLRLNVVNFAVGAALANVHLGIDVVAGEAHATLATISCPSGVSSPVRLQPVVGLVAGSSLATVAIGAYDIGNPAAPVTKGSLVSVAGGTVSIDVKNAPIPLTIPGAADAPLTFTGPFDNKDPADGNTVMTVGALANTSGAVSDAFAQLGSNLTATVQLPLLPAITIPADAVASTLSSVVVPVLAVVVDPLLASLGVTVGGATITMQSVQFDNNGNLPSKTSVPSLFNERRSSDAAPAAR